MTLIVPAILALAGCKDVPLSPATPTDSDLPTVEGFYLLQTVNGSTRPVTIETRPGFMLEILDASFGINASPNFRSSTTYRKTENGLATSYLEVCTGTYSYAAGGLPHGPGNFVLSETAVANTSCGKDYSGSWDGATKITIDFESARHATYQK